MSAPTEEQLISAVQALRISLLSYDAEAANDPTELSKKLKMIILLGKKVLNQKMLKKL
jgi:hypothetical protein